jgi:hypothetical protein
MAKVIAKPKYTAAQTAWLLVNGPLATTVAGWPAVVGKDGTVTISERPEIVATTLLFSPPASLAADVNAAAPGWIDGYMALGGMG